MAGKMCFFWAGLILLTYLAQANSEGSSDMTERVDKYRDVCARYSDPRRVEHSALFDATVSITKHYRSTPNKFFICTPPKTGSQTWRRLMIMQNAQDNQHLYPDPDPSDEEESDEASVEVAESVAEVGQPEEATIPLPEEASIPLPEQASIPLYEDPMEAYRTSFRAIQVRHPLERLLSAYLFVFVDSSVHRDLSEKVQTAWLSQRRDRLTPTEGEITQDSGGYKTLSFRQFVNFLTKCPAEWRECMILMNEGLAQHWIPYWRWCSPCAPGYEFHFISKLETLREDKDTIFDMVGMNNTIELANVNPTKVAHASEMSTKEKYFGQLTQQEIYDLYLKYKLDHDLFDYSPDEYLKMAKDASL